MGLCRLVAGNGASGGEGAVRAIVPGFMFCICLFPPLVGGGRARPAGPEAGRMAGPRRAGQAAGPAGTAR